MKFLQSRRLDGRFKVEARGFGITRGNSFKVADSTGEGGTYTRFGANNLHNL